MPTTAQRAGLLVALLLAAIVGPTVLAGAVLGVLVDRLLR
jgi:hypothetical protein